MVMLRRPGTESALLMGIVLACCSPIPPNHTDFSAPTAESTRTADGTAAAETAEPKRLGGTFRSSVPEWITRIETRSSTNQAGLSDVTVQSLQPIYPLSDDDEAVFTQIRMNRNAQGEAPSAVSNLGVGYRRLVEPDLMVGVNGFYDRDWTGANHRAGADTELRWRAIDLGFHYYLGLDGPGSEDGSGVALDGYNFEIATQVPFLPWARAQFSTSEFFAGADDGSAASYTTGVQLGLLHNVSLLAGTRGFGTLNEVGFVGLNVRFDGTPPPRGSQRYLLSDDPIAPVAFEPRDLERHLMDRVRRIDAIPVGY